MRLTGLIYAAVHSAIDLELGGRASDKKGLASVEATVGLLLESRQHCCHPAAASAPQNYPFQLPAAAVHTPRVPD